MLTRASRIRRQFRRGEISYLAAFRELVINHHWHAVHADHYLMLGLQSGKRG